MKDRILHLCKRLSNFTLDEILIISEVKENVLIQILNELVYENKLIFINPQYRYNNIKYKSVKNRKLPIFFEFHSKEKIDLIMKCFCAEIPIVKAKLIVDLCQDTVTKFYSFFRNQLYEVQFSELKEHYKHQPKNPSIRALYDKKICLYTYNDKIYISEKPLIPTKEIRKHTKEEFRKSNMAYYKIRRVFQNYGYTQCVAKIAYEKLWMQGKTQDAKMNYLKNLLNIV